VLGGAFGSLEHGRIVSRKGPGDARCAASFLGLRENTFDSRSLAED